MASGNSHGFGHQHFCHHDWLEKSVCSICQDVYFRGVANTKKHSKDSDQCKATAAPLVTWSPYANWQPGKGKFIIRRNNWFWSWWGTAGTCREPGAMCSAFQWPSCGDSWCFQAQFKLQLGNRANMAWLGHGPKDLDAAWKSPRTPEVLPKGEGNRR